MQKKGLRNFKEITPFFQSYIEDPEGTYEKAKAEIEVTAVTPPEPAGVKR
jgi:hypothetical protein